MYEVPVFYATTEGQTHRIAERLAGRIREHGLNAQAIQIGSAHAEAVDWDNVRGVCLGASIHMQKHQPAAVRFAEAHAHRLSAHPSLFFSASLAAASKNAKEVAAARKLAQRFADETGWQPSHIASVAGRLAYAQYGWLKRFLMRRIAIKEGGSGDTSRDHEYTDWQQVSALADALVRNIRQAEQQAAKASA